MRPLASRNVVVPFESVVAVPVVRPDPSRNVRVPLASRVAVPVIRPLPSRYVTVPLASRLAVPVMRPILSLNVSAIRRAIPEGASRAMREYLATLDNAAFGAASEVVPKFVSPSDPAAQWTGAMRGPAFFAYADNYLVDVKVGIIMDVKASRAIRQAEVGAAKAMIERTEERFEIKPIYLAADTAYGSADHCRERGVSGASSLRCSVAR
jgi:hypothetical protein